MLDGWIARRTHSESALGAKLDVFADCAAIFPIQVFLMTANDWPVYLLLLSLLSILSFILCVRRRRNVSKNTFGRFVGAILIGTFLINALCNMFDPALWDTAAGTAAHARPL
jgi:phosphatidylglycerophosphate synthase